ncbi:hypothetical protein [Granulicoccus phenolivorans]|uniref:hypothetical protein n=1 Tax=Granulicoccus phenolivorans TaxID=266854 RepID=UPI0003F7B2A6|nr:hypothetical protein [Granulicoccus phenolivorans]
MNKKIAITLATGAGITAAALGGAGLAFAAPTATPTDSPSASTSASPTDTSTDRGHRQGMDTATLAQKLGVDEAKLKTALQEIRQANAQQNKDGSNRPDPTARKAELAKQLAEKLGIDEAKVTAALDEVQQAAQTQHRDQLKSRLDQSVTDGKLTQADADSVLKAFDAGVLGGR